MDENEQYIHDIINCLINVLENGSDTDRSQLVKLLKQNGLDTKL